jgi:predicted phosphodiesterase
MQEKPELTIACFADLHIDYGIQNYTHPNREGTINACKEISKSENVDVALVGGDTVSSNTRVDWDFETFSKVRTTVHHDLKSATKTGKVIYANGNHDYQVGFANGFNSYDYEEIMNKDIGPFKSVLYQKDDKTLSHQKYSLNILAFHYQLHGYDFIVLNQPYASKDLTNTQEFYSIGTLKWFENTLESLAKQNRRVVFVTSHYALRDSRNMPNPPELPRKLHKKLKNILFKGQQYPRIIWLYGHYHGNDSGKRGIKHDAYINFDTFQRITPYTPQGKVVKRRESSPKGAISCFMGSMTYYQNKYDDYNWLTEKTPVIIQALLIYVYKDRIVFHMKNYGENHSGSAELLPYEILR